MRNKTHLKIVFCLKAVLFGLFFANCGRILWRTWKYGGSKSTHEVTFDGQGNVGFSDEIEPYDSDEE